MRDIVSSTDKETSCLQPQEAIYSVHSYLVVDIGSCLEEEKRNDHLVSVISGTSSPKLTA